MKHVDCNECGTSLEIGKDTRFVTCGSCSSRLSVVRSHNAIYTEVLSTGVTALKDELRRLEVEAVPAAAASGSASEAILRIVVGILIIGSDIFWWVIDPSLQQLWVRIVLGLAGAWLILSGVWTAVATGRQRSRILADAKAERDRRKDELKREIAANEASEQT